MSRTRIEIAATAHDDFERILEHFESYDVADPVRRLQEITEGISILSLNPLIGTRFQQDLRELVIGRKARGYVVLYRYASEIDTVFVLAIRSQREAGYVN